MEFILNNRKYSILNHELYINYLMVNEYFRYHSRYDYDIHFDFIEPLLEKDKVEFEDILEGTKVIEDLIAAEKISFIPYGVRIDEDSNGKFKITYQDLEFVNVNVGEAIPLLIVLHSLLNAKPVVTLAQIKEEIENFLEKFRNYN